MKLLVLIKQVPDTEAKITLGDDSINEEGIKWIISPYDEIALEEALRLKEKHPDTEITAVSVGIDRAISSLRTAYAMGADHAILIKHDQYEMLDSSTIANAILKIIEGENYDIILAGRQATDSDNGQVPLILATKLGLPLASFANEIKVSADKVSLTCEAENGEAVYESSLPIVVTANDRLNEPRYPSLKGIMASKKKSPTIKEITELGIELNAGIEVLGFRLPDSRPTGRIIEGESPEEKVKGLVDALHNEVKII